MRINDVFPIFSDTSGSPLNAGFVYIGVANANPETNPANVYWDSARTQLAAQPLRTSGGYIVHNGSPANVFTSQVYSITVRDYANRLVYSQPSSDSYDTLASLPLVVNTISDLRAADKNGVRQIFVKGYYATGDGGGGTYYLDPNDVSSSDNNGTIIVGTDGGRWKLNAAGIIITSAHFGAKGDGTTDDTTALQFFISAVAGGIGWLKPGVFMCSQLVVSSGTTLIGYGQGISIIKAVLTLGNVPLVRNNVQSGTVNTYYDKDINFYHMTIDGNNLGSRTAELVSIAKARNVIFEKVQIRNVGYIGLAIGGSQSCKVTKCDFTATGNPVVTAEGGAAIWMGTTSDTSRSNNMVIESNAIYNCEWSAIYANGDAIKIIDNDIRDNKESSIFSSTPAIGLTVIGNRINGTTKKNISGSGLEIGGSQITISGNYINNTANDCISITDVQGCNITGNILANCRQDSVSFPTGSGIGLISTAADPNQPRWVNISGNTFTAFSPQPYSFVSIGGAGAAIKDCSITDNVCSSLTFSSGKGIAMAAGKVGVNVKMRGNLGCADGPGFVTGLFQAPAGTGSFAVTGLGFKPSALELIGIAPSGTAAQLSVGSTDGTNQNVVRMGSSGSNHAGGPTSNKLIALVDSAAVDICVASLTSLDQDGFTLNFTITTARPWCLYKAFG